MDEQRLLENSRAGSVDAFNVLVETYQSQVYNVALRLLGDGEAAADATQDCFVSAFQGIGKFRGGSFRGWLLRIATNACYDRLRASKRHRSTSLDALTDDPEEPRDFLDPQELPEDHLLRRELAEVIQSGLDSLPFDQKVVVVLSDVQGFAYEEIAEITASSLGTVKSRLSRGRARMRDYLLKQRELLPVRYRL